MQTFNYIKAASSRQGTARHRAAGREVHRRRHHAGRPDEAERRDARDARRYQSVAARQDGDAARWRTADRRDGAQFGPGMECRRAEEYAVLSQALLSGASPQLRNMATTGGNLLQRTRCVVLPRAQRGHARRLWLQQAHAGNGMCGARMDSTARMPFWAPATTASRPILRTCALPWRLWKQ